VATARRALPFRPERVWSYEAGLKSDLLNRTLRVNVTGFHAITKDLQVNRSVPVPGEGGLQQLQDNAGTMKVTGVELEATLVPTDGMSIFLSGAYTDARYTFIRPQTGVPAAAQITTATQPVRTPPIAFTLGAIYDAPVAGMNGSLGGSLVGRYTDPFWTTNANTPGSRTNSSVFVDAELRYRHESGVWTAGVGCTNCFKTREFTAFLVGFYYAEEPRRFTGRLSYNF
jgi:iron complex outermembrane receptor protein